MSKRFTDSEKFSDIWYRKLPILQKVMYEYLIAECNHAGILEKFDIELMSFKIGADITEEDFKLLDDRVIFLSDNVLYLTKFCKFQYGELNPQNKVHNSVIKELNKWGLQAPTIPLNSTLLGTKNKDKDKDKDIYTPIKEKENQEKKKKVDPFSEIKPKLQAICKDVFEETIFITADDCIKAAELASEFDDFFEKLPEHLRLIKTLNFKGYKPKLQWLLKDNHYIDVRNGVYSQTAAEKQNLTELKKVKTEDEILAELRAKYG